MTRSESARLPRLGAQVLSCKRDGRFKSTARSRRGRTAMMTLPRPQDLNVVILRLAHERKAVAEAEMPALLAFEVSFHGDLRVCDEIDVWRFSAIVNIARERLVPYGFLRIDADKDPATPTRGQNLL